MRTKILMLIVLMGLSATMMAQQAGNDSTKSFRAHSREMRINEDRRGAQNGMNLTSEQRDAFKKSMMDTQKQLQPLRNQLGELKAHQKTLMTAEKPDVNEVNKNIEKIGDLKVEMAKIQAKNRLEMRAQLNDDQRLMFDTHAGKMMHNKAGQGMRQGRGMQDAHPMNN